MLQRVIKYEKIDCMKIYSRQFPQDADGGHKPAIGETFTGNVIVIPMVKANRKQINMQTLIVLKCTET